MTMQGQPSGEPGESVSALDDLANALMPSEQEDKQETDADPNASEGDEESEEVETEEEEADEEAEDEDAEKFTIKVDGKEIQATKAELIEYAQKGFDYTNKTMAVAEERKAIESERAHVAEVRKNSEAAQEALLARFEAATNFLKDQLGDPPSVELIQTHGAEHYLAHKAHYEARQGQLQQALQGVEQLRGEQNRQRQSDLIARANDTIKELKNTLPGFNDNTMPELEKYAESLGITLQSAEKGYVLKGLWQALHKAQAYDAIQAKKAEMKPVKQLQKVNKPAAANPTGKAAERAKRDAEFNKNPSVDALANILRAR